MNPVQKAWQTAATELAIRVRSGESLLGIQDDPARLLFLPDFGGPLGAVVFVQSFEDCSTDTFDLDSPSSAGYYCSILSQESYSQFDRDHFIDTLVDWGFYGSDHYRPDWLPDSNRSEQGVDRKPDHVPS